MRTRILAIVAWLAAGCVTGLPKTPEPTEAEQIQIDSSAQALVAAGYSDEEVDDLLHMFERRHIPADVRVEAMDAAARGAQQYGPVGDLTEWMQETTYKDRVTGPPLERLVVAHHMTFGSLRLGSPPGPAETSPSGGASGSATTPQS